MPAQLIGLIGKKRVGKDTAAKFLIEDHGFVRYAFADPLKATMLDLNPYLPPTAYPGNLSPSGPTRFRDLVEAVGEDAAKALSPEVRRLWQAHGVAMRERVDPDIWLRATMERVAAEDRPVVITDVRFPNEAAAIQAAGGRLVRVTRASAPNDDSHLSETALDAWLCDAVIANDGSVEALRSSVWHLV
ncbi:MAG TPA: hypothetical protein VNC22_03175 [Sporichthya sp.]|jgi:hypothetical protein|nr:hypothetical protein [Sporichthya sp.]